jgi:hypothetical protein
MDVLDTLRFCLSQLYHEDVEEPLENVTPPVPWSTGTLDNNNSKASQQQDALGAVQSITIDPTHYLFPAPTTTTNVYRSLRNANQYIGSFCLCLYGLHNHV